MNFNTLDSYLAPEQVAGYAGTGLIAYAGYTAAKDLYHLGFAGYAAIGEEWTTDPDSQKWYADKKVDHWHAATGNWKRDAAVIVGAGLTGYYCHRYIAPMVGEASRAWDTSVDVMRAVNDAGLSERVETLTYTLDSILASAESVAATAETFSGTAGALINTIDVKNLTADVTSLQKTIHLLSGTTAEVSENLVSLPETINATLTTANETNAFVSGLLGGMNATRLSEDLVALQSGARSITAATVNASGSLELVPSIVRNLHNTTATVNQLMGDVQVPWVVRTTWF